MQEISYQIKLAVFEGPFDVLLKALDEGRIDLWQVSITQITTAYFSYWQEQSPPLVLASDFLIMAAYLLELKSKALLPQKEQLNPQEQEEIANLEESLVKHIQEYQMFKQLALNLKDRKSVFAKIYSRHEGEKVHSEIALVDVSLRDLVVAFQKVYREAANREKIFAITSEELTLEERLAEIKQILGQRNDGIPFEDLFLRKTRLEVVITFLAILELAKQREIQIKQGGRFGSIQIFAAVAVDVPAEERVEEVIYDGNRTA